MAIPESIWRLVLTTKLHNQTCMTTFWFRSKVASTMSSLQAMADFIIQDYELAFRSSFLACMSSEVQLLQAAAQCMSIPNSAQSIKNYTTYFGSQAGEALPSYVASVISFYTSAPGRRTHGRIYIPGIAEADQSGSFLTTAATTRHATFASALANRYGDGGSSVHLYLVVYSKKNGVTRMPGPPPYLQYLVEAGVPVQTVNVNTKLGTQRHRLVGKGF